MTALSVLVPDVRVEVPDIPSFVAERQLLRAAREFCEETRAWRVNVQISVTATVATRNIASLLPTNTELVDVVSIKNTGGGRPVTPTTFAWLDTNHANWRSDTDLNAQYYVLDGNNAIRFVPTPSTTTAALYNARLAVKPTLSASSISDVLGNKYDEVLVHGALSKLFLIPRKPWTDANLAQFHMGLFRASFAPARTEAAEEFQTGIPRKVKYGGL